MKSVKSAPTGCEINVDLTFTSDFNNGSAFAIIHLWENAQYPSLSYAGAPTSAQLSNAVANIVIKNPGSNSAALHNQYPQDNSVPVVYSGVTFSKTGSGPYNFTLSNVKLVIPSCSQTITLRGDVWSSQSNQAQNVHCNNPGQIDYPFTSTLVSGTLFCSTPRQFSINIDNSSSGASATATYKVYVDDGDNVFEPAGGDVLIYTTPSSINVNAGELYVSSPGNYDPAYSNTSPWQDHNLFIDATVIKGITTISYPGISIGNTCPASSTQPLPVTFKSFSAVRTRNQVSLQWETSMERNNKGFYIQCKIGNDWKDISFIVPQNEDGNSNSDLSYHFEDINLNKGVSLYRILQMDIDGKTLLSNVCSVAGEKQMPGILVFPNPSTDGKINIVFENGNLKREVLIRDRVGRLVKQYKNVTGYRLTFELVNSGYYYVEVFDMDTMSKTVEKILVSK